MCELLIFLTTILIYVLIRNIWAYGNISRDFNNYSNIPVELRRNKEYIPPNYDELFLKFWLWDFEKFRRSCE